MLSVLLPFRDAEGTVREALTSVLAETVVDEVVCIDGARRVDFIVSGRARRQ